MTTLRCDQSGHTENSQGRSYGLNADAGTFKVNATFGTANYIRRAWLAQVCVSLEQAKIKVRDMVREAAA